MADEDFGEAGLGRSPASATSRPLVGIVDGEGYRLKIPFVVEAGFLDEALVFGIVRNRKEWLAVIGLADPVEVRVKESVGAGQQARGLRRRVLAELDSQRYCCGYCNDRERNG
ncbi:MAG: hypothetical protein ACRD9W_06475, partial [Terriglobia bacterium]